VSIEADRPPNHTPSRAVATGAVNGGLIGLFFVRLSLLAGAPGARGVRAQGLVVLSPGRC
jgi:hypothetical protein